MNATADRLRALAKGPALDLPPVRWEAPAGVSSDRPVVRWGALPWEVELDAARGWPRVYLCAFDTRSFDAPFFEVGDPSYTVAEAKVLLNRLASAIAMAEELSR